MNFERALLHIFKVEGGFVDNPDDRGGPTNFGITLKTLQAFRKAPVTVYALENLTPSEASEIYRQEFWDGNALFLLESARLQIIFFDQIVARGAHAAIIMVQRVLNTHFKAGLKYDGEMGPLTAGLVNAANDRLIGAMFIREAQKAYVKQAFHEPSQMKFLEGWLNRTFRLFDFLF